MLSRAPSLCAEGSKVKCFKIYRYDPEVPGQKPYIATYALNLNECVLRPLAIARAFLFLH